MLTVTVVRASRIFYSPASLLMNYMLCIEDSTNCRKRPKIGLDVCCRLLCYRYFVVEGLLPFTIVVYTEERQSAASINQAKNILFE